MLMVYLGFPGGSVVENPPPVQEMPETQVPSLGQKDPLEEEMATRSGTLAWKVPWIGEHGGLHSPWGCKELDMTEAIENVRRAYMQCFT